MIEYRHGDITKAEVEAIINTVNTVGVMGKGIALSFKKEFPNNYKAYKEACKKGEVRTGRMFVTPSGRILPRLIINFPTKEHWRNPSKYEYIEEGLKDLILVIKRENLKSIAIPPLGSGNGGLDWAKVKDMILDKFQDVSSDIKVVVFEPGIESAQAVSIPSNKLTPARVMLLDLMMHYEMLGEWVTPLVTQKLAYFLQKSGEPMKLNFEKGPYGPYAHQLTKVLEVLKPHFILYEGQITNPSIHITLHKDIVAQIEEFKSTELTDEQLSRLVNVKEQIIGFENALGLELLATVDFALLNCPECSLSEITSTIHNWTNRKRELLTQHLVQVAYNRVSQVNEITSNSLYS